MSVNSFRFGQLVLLLEESQSHVEKVDKPLIDIGRKFFMNQSSVARRQIADEMSVPAPRPLLFGKTGLVFHNLQECFGAGRELGHSTVLGFGVLVKCGKRIFGKRSGESIGKCLMADNLYDNTRGCREGMSKVYPYDAGFISDVPPT